MPSAPYGQVAELAILAARSGDNADVRAAEFVVLVVTGMPPSRFTPATELVALAATQQDNVMVQVTEAALLVAYVTGGTEKFNSRAWGFNSDQHQFYVMHLGVEGTFVYDVLSQEWAQWQTEGFVGWNAEHGVEWNNEVYFADVALPTLWRMDYTADIDEDFRTIRRVVTGGIPASARETLKTGMFTLSATIQGALVDDSSEAPQVTLSISDDGGKTFRSRETIEVDGNERQDITWKGLGMIKAPGRVFQVEDRGGFICIEGAEQKIDGEK